MREGLFVAREARQTRGVDALAVVHVEEDRPGDVHLRTARADHLPVDDGGGGGPVEDDVSHARVTPDQARGLPLRPILLQPTERRLGGRLRPSAGGPGEVVLVLGDPLVESGGPPLRRVEESEAHSPMVQPVDLGHRLEAVEPDRCTLLRRGLRQPAGLVVGRVVRRHAAFDLAHDVEGRIEEVAVLLFEPVHLRDRHVGGCEQLHGLELKAEVVGGKDLKARGLDPDHQGLFVDLPSLLPREVEEKRLVGESGRGRSCEIRDLDLRRLRQLGSQPTGQLLTCVFQISFPRRRHAGFPFSGFVSGEARRAGRWLPTRVRRIRRSPSP